MMSTARETRRTSSDSVYCLLDGQPMHKRIAGANLYCELCFIQERLENLLEEYRL